MQAGGDRQEACTRVGRLATPAEGQHCAQVWRRDPLGSRTRCPCRGPLCTPTSVFLLGPWLPGGWRLRSSVHLGPQSWRGTSGFAKMMTFFDCRRREAVHLCRHGFHPCSCTRAWPPALLDHSLVARGMAPTTMPEVACVPSHDRRRLINYSSPLWLFLLLEAVGETIYSDAI